MKMVYFLIAILLTIVFLNCSAQQGLVSKKIEQQFMKWIIAQQQEVNISKYAILVTVDKFWRLRTDIQYSKKDSINIESQITRNKQTLINVDLPSKKRYINDLSKQEKYLKITKPVFFDDGKKVWIYLQHYCLADCGFESAEVYEVSNNGFKKLSEIIIYNRGE